MSVDIETFESILEEIKAGQVEQFGDDLNTGNASNNIKFTFPIVSNLLRKYEQLQLFIDSSDIYKAEGLWLDALLSNFNFIRKQASQATCTWVTSDSTPNSIVNPGELIVKDTFGHVFANTSSVTIALDGSGTLNMVSIGTGIEFNVLENTLTEIVTPIAGINTGTNTLASEGQDKESDFNFRIRFLAGRAGKSFWNISGIYNAIRELDGVLSVFVEENDTNVTVGDLTAHSLRVVVDGGSDEEIAETLFEKSDSAIERIGTTTIIVNDIQGEPRQIKFQRPTIIDIEYSFSISGTADTPSVTTAIKNYIDTAGVRATISTYQCIKYVETSISLEQVQSIDIFFRVSGDTSWLTSLTYGQTEKGSGVLVP